MMKRPSVYPYTCKEPPGCNIHRLRLERGWALRELARRCDPPLTFASLSRIEKNMGYKHDSLRRIARALGVADVDLLIPLERGQRSGTPPSAMEGMMKSPELSNTQGQHDVLGSGTVRRKRFNSGNSASHKRPLAGVSAEIANLKAENTELKARYDQLKRMFARYLMQDHA